MSRDSDDLRLVMSTVLSAIESHGLIHDEDWPAMRAELDQIRATCRDAGQSQFATGATVLLALLLNTEGAMSEHGEQCALVYCAAIVCMEQPDARR